MKTLMIFLVSAAMICGVQAKSFEASHGGAAHKKYRTSKVDISKPAPVGMVETMSKYGMDAFNPWAPAECGSGMVASNIAGAEGNEDPEQRNRDCGGIVIFGYLF